VIWAREDSPAAMQELLQYYRSRRVWLVEPDAVPATVAPYPSVVKTPENQSQ